MTGLLAVSLFLPAVRAEGATAAFEELFEEIGADEITDNVFNLVGKTITVITAGRIGEHNSMAASWGGFGILFDKPATWCFLSASRFTLEKMQAEGSYTFSWFPDEYKEDVLFFGGKSGRDSDKMKESKLTPVATPSGLATYAEARLVIECRLVEVTTVAPDDFRTEESRKFIEDGRKTAPDYHKIALGEIAKVWRKKPR
jgi:flavin reductase (DIM6/NTAB) family NADH-FMN oxidoreductase RutF